MAQFPCIKTKDLNKVAMRLIANHKEVSILRIKQLFKQYTYVYFNTIYNEFHFRHKQLAYWNTDICDPLDEFIERIEHHLLMELN